jgi:hypothetical protein
MKKWLVIIIILCVSNNSHAQITLNMLNQELYHTRVKLVDEFISRFNGEELRPDLNKDLQNLNKTNLLLLFNSKLFKSKNDPLFAEAQEMVDTILANGTKIQYSDTTWVAKALCHGRFKDKDVEFVMYLTVEQREEDMYKWVIAKVEGEIFKLNPSVKSSKIMISPDAHETNFMALRRVTTEKGDYITNYGLKNLSIDQTSVFYSYVYNGWLEIEYVKDLEFMFFQVPQYQFSIKHFDRDEINAGWLISSFQKISEQEKRNFLNYIYK